MSNREELLKEYGLTEDDVQVDEEDNEFITYTKADEHEIDGRVIEGEERVIKVYL